MTAVSRAEVVDAALTAFADRGYHGTSLKDIATAVGLQTPSLYNHISAKSDLLIEIVFTTLTAVRSDFDRGLAVSIDPVDKLYNTTFLYALRHATHRRASRVVNQDTLHLPATERAEAQAIRRRHEQDFRALITDGVAQGIFDTPTPKLASFAIREMCVSVARWFQDDRGLSPEQVAVSYADQALRLVGVAMEHRPSPSAARIGCTALRLPPP